MIYGFNSFGYEGFLFKVETEVKDGVPAIDIAGLADSCVSSTRELVRTAIEQSGFEIPRKRILVSLSPLDLKMEIYSLFRFAVRTTLSFISALKIKRSLKCLL